jgi:hypothetical protein
MAGAGEAAEGAVVEGGGKAWVGVATGCSGSTGPCTGGGAGEGAGGSW